MLVWAVRRKLAGTEWSMSSGRRDYDSFFYFYFWRIVFFLLPQKVECRECGKKFLVKNMCCTDLECYGHSHWEEEEEQVVEEPG